MCAAWAFKQSGDIPWILQAFSRYLLSYSHVLRGSKLIESEKAVSLVSLSG